MIRNKIFDNKVSFCFSLLEDGNMRAFDDKTEPEIIANQSRLAEMTGADPSKTARIRTIYDNRNSFSEYFEITEDNVQDFCILRHGADLKVCDGLATRSHDIAVLLPLADCLGIVFYDSVKDIFGIVHSGRQNLEDGGARKFVEFLRDSFSCEPSNLQAWFSPHALGFQIYKLDNKTLGEAAVEQLIATGVPEANIHREARNTVSDPELPSYSSGDSTTRFAICAKML